MVKDPVYPDDNFLIHLEYLRINMQHKTFKLLRRLRLVGQTFRGHILLPRILVHQINLPIDYDYQGLVCQIFLEHDNEKKIRKFSLFV